MKAATHLSDRDRDDVSGLGSLLSRVADLDREVNDVAGILNVQHARLVDVVIAMLDDDRLWSGHSMTSEASWLAWRAGVSPATASAIVTIARRATDLPETLASFRRGELSLDQTAAIARQAPWWCDEQARDYGRVMTVQQLRSVLGAYPYPALDADGREVRHPQSPDDDAASAHPDEPEPSSADSRSEPESGDSDDGHATPNGLRVELPEEWCAITVGDDGMVRLSAGLHPESGQVVQQALDAARDHLFRHGHTDVDTVDALRHMAERSLDAETDQRRHSRFDIAVRIDLTSSTMIDTAGWTVPDAIRRYISCDGLLTPTFFENGAPVSVGRSQYVVPQRTRTVIRHRDHARCRVPGCDARLGLEVHHIIHWEHGGRTDTSNLVMICGKHHRLHHRGRLGISGDADASDGLEFRTADGRIIPSSGAAPNRSTGPPPRPDKPYEHPDGGRLDKAWIHFQPPPAHIEELRAAADSDAAYLGLLSPPWMN